MQAADAAEAMQLLGSQRFEAEYFERSPLHITLADSGSRLWAAGCPVGLEASILGQQKWAYEAVGPSDGHHRSLVFKHGSFLPKDAAPGWRRGDVVRRADVEAALDGGATVK